MAFSNPYSPYLFGSALIALIIAILTWPRRSAPGAFPLLLMLLTTVIWAGANGMIFEMKDPAARRLWFNVLLVGSIWGTPAFWAFGLQYTHRNHWLTHRNIFLICLMPAVSLFLAWTTDLHKLFYSSIDFIHTLPNGNWLVMPGPWLGIHLLYSYAVVLFTIGIIIQAFFRASPMHRGQAGTILAGTLIPLIGNIIYNLMIHPGNGAIDPTPFLFTIMGIIYAYGLFGYQLFDIVPIARHALVERMTDGVLVVDAQNRVVDINPAALSWLQLTDSSPVGKPLKDLLVDLPANLIRYYDERSIQTEVQIGTKDNTHFDLRIEPLFDRRKHFNGRLIIFRDITQKKQAEDALQQANDRLTIQLNEIETLQRELQDQAMNDPLTGLFNRRYLQEILGRELARAAHNNSPLSLSIMDIDYFKILNDQNGHSVGDLVLQALAKLLRTHARAGDVACRYGGDEFVMVLPGANLEVAARRADEWRRDFEKLSVSFDNKTIFSTLSLGVAVFPLHGTTHDELLLNADNALYRSKNNGRNQVSLSVAD